ncbi:PPOX class F420-dependent oxidoreductase [Actinomadura vinacea]|uniref:PPOX class F420-dependent oxidoreductase n=1 Tax=Actinomadura vinacea TaxID=115336 RepID=A0ABP5VMT0_9ACTN
MTFTANEIEYLKSQPLGRLATVGPGGRPHIVPLGVFYDPEARSIVIGGLAGTGMAASKKFRDARRHPEVAFAVDDLASTDPWAPRGIEIRGRAETHTTGGEEIGRRIGAAMPFDPAWIRIHPRRILTRGIDTGPFELSARDVPLGSVHPVGGAS